MRDDSQLLLMSEKSQCSRLREIWQLDEQFEFREEAQDAEKIRQTRLLPRGVCSRFWIARARRLQEIYKTGCITRRPLPTRSEQVEIPPECLVKCADVGETTATGRPITVPVEVRSGDAATTYVKIPDEVLYPKDELLYPKRRRGRPRNQAVQALANSQRCSIRHARRLLTSGKQRKRVRESPSSEEEWALQQRKKRAKLIQALKQEQFTNHLAYRLNLLNHWEAYKKAWEDCDYGLVDNLLSSEISASTRQFAERMVADKGIAEALVICNFAFPRLGLRCASIQLGVSRSTIYRRFRGRLKSLRHAGETLRTTALPDADVPQVAGIMEPIETPWSQQTTWKKTAVRNGNRFSPENFRGVY